PNLGYGRFGKRVAMANAPRLSHDGSRTFNPKRLFLADLNGTGCADLVYVDTNRVYFWFNQCGNAWSTQQIIHGTPRTTDQSALELADIFGTGTATLLWSEDFAGGSQSNYKALDFCGGVKPYLLTSMNNNMGATTRVQYAPSTRYYLEDREQGRPWISSLPFPVQVVAKVEVIDHVSRCKQVTTYKYHHGHYDGGEREFCGFGRIDQFDSETFEEFSEPGLHGTNLPLANVDAAYHVSPVETRTWFHTGMHLDGQNLGHQYRQEYYQGDEQVMPLGDPVVATGGAVSEAYRALRGAQLRSEVYAHDGTSSAIHPYKVDEQRHRVSLLQTRQDNHHAVFHRHVLESSTRHYERNPQDPRVSHEMTLEVDAFGNPLRTLSIGYGRRQANSTLPTQADRDKQTRTLVTYTETRYTNAIDDRLSDAYRTPISCETRTCEFTGLSQTTGRFSLDEWVADDFALIRNARGPASGQRLIEHTQTRYRRDDLTDLLPLGMLETLALPGERRQLALGTGGTWWIPSERVFYSPGISDTPVEELTFARRHFFLACRERDSFGNTALTFTDPYALLVSETHDATDNRTRAEHDYRLLQPWRITDSNGTRTEVVFDTLGMVVATAIVGKAGETWGGSLHDVILNPTTQQRAAFFTDPVTHVAEMIGSATARVVYDVERYQRQREPVCVAVLTRETHVSDSAPSGRLRVQIGVSYCDGFGCSIQSKTLVGPGSLLPGGPVLQRRWIGTGWTVFNNKNQPIKQFEPFFDDTPGFRFDRRIGVSSTTFRDPLGRVVAVLHPSHTWQKVWFDAWRREAWDVDDTVLIDDPARDVHVGVYFERLASAEYLPTWHQQRQAGQLGEQERTAAQQAAVHAATPVIEHFDALGRVYGSTSYPVAPVEAKTQRIRRQISISDAVGHSIVIGATPERGVSAIKLWTDASEIHLSRFCKGRTPAWSQ
ncbi:MAG: toxin TcdB middle/C-terminal domain-containing protein, partial [Steroidobacter sp.]